MRSGSWQFGTFAKAFLSGSTLFGLQLPAMTSSVVAAWSLGIEAVFYMVFPISGPSLCEYETSQLVGYGGHPHLCATMRDISDQR